MYNPKYFHTRNKKGKLLGEGEGREPNKQTNTIKSNSKKKQSSTIFQRHHWDIKLNTYICKYIHYKSKTTNTVRLNETNELIGFPSTVQSSHCGLYGTSGRGGSKKMDTGQFPLTFKTGDDVRAYFMAQNYTFQLSFFPCAADPLIYPCCIFPFTGSNAWVKRCEVQGLE